MQGMRRQFAGLVSTRFSTSPSAVVERVSAENEALILGASGGDLLANRPTSARQAD